MFKYFRYIAIALLFAFNPINVGAQKTSVSVIYVVGVPSTCINGRLYVNVSTGNIYSYKNGVGCILSGNTSGGIGGSTGITDNALLRADGISGSALQSSNASIDDTGNLTLNSGGQLKFGSDVGIRRQSASTLELTDGTSEGAYLRTNGVYGRNSGTNTTKSFLGFIFRLSSDTCVQWGNTNNLETLGAISLAICLTDTRVAKITNENSAIGGAVQVGDTAANIPTCSSTTRGAIYVQHSTAGAGDILQVCMKGTDDNYAWRSVFTAP